MSNQHAITFLHRAQNVILPQLKMPCFPKQHKMGITLVGTPSEKLEWKYSELSNFHKIWNVIHDSKYQIEEKLGSEMFR